MFFVFILFLFVLKFLANYTIDPTVTDILNTFDVYILPVFNVDGYAYTWNKVVFFSTK